MSLRPFYHNGHHGHHGRYHPDPFFLDFDRDLQRFENNTLRPYWRHADHLNFNSAVDIGEIVDNDEKFGVKLDVSHFKPEELKVNLDGRQLTVQGNHESKSEHGHTQRSFVRKFILPESVNLEAVKSHLSNDGHLSIEAPKAAFSQGRAIPIQTNGSEKH